VAQRQPRLRLVLVQVLCEADCDVAGEASDGDEAIRLADWH
jgi:DNA-binding NarL/FixJ family response regulator